MSRPTLKRFVAILVAATLVALPLQLVAQHSGAPRERKHIAREQIEQLEREWRTAQLDDDVLAMDKLLSDDYLGINSAGQVVTKTQQLDHMRTRQLAIQKLDTSDLKIRLIGPIAIVTSLAQVEGVSNGSPLSGSFRYTRIYHRLSSGVWKITNFEATHIPHTHYSSQASAPQP